MDSAIHLLQYWGLEKIAYVAGVERGRGLEGWKKKRKGGCMVGRRLLLENVVIKVVAFFTNY